MTQPALRLTHHDQPSRRFDALRVLWDVVDAGLLAQFSPAEAKVWVAMLRHANTTTALAWPGMDTLMDETGLKQRAIQTARRRLEDRGLIALDRAGGGHDSSRYAVLHPPPHADAPPDVPPHLRAPTPACSCGAEAHQDAGEAAKEATNEAAAGPPPPRGLFDPAPPADRGAIDVLVELGLPRRQAAGLVAAYRPTAVEAANVAANVRAKQDAAERGECERVRSVAAFVRAAVKAGDYELDDRVLEQRRRERSKQRAAERAAQAARQRAEAEAAEAVRRQRLADDAARWAAIPLVDRQRLNNAAIARLEPIYREFAKRQSIDHPLTIERGLAELDRESINKEIRS